MKAFILVGGEGTRMRPLTSKLPKPLIPVLNKPLLEYTLKHLKAQGINEVVLLSNYQAEKLQSYFGDGERFGLKIHHVIEEHPLGTGGAVKNAAHLVDDTFFVLNGDIFAQFDLRKMLHFHRENKSLLTIALKPISHPRDYGVIETDGNGRILLFREKPLVNEMISEIANINAGVYILEPPILDKITPNTYYMFERRLFPMMALSGEPIYGYVFNDYWIDVGTPYKYLELTYHLLREEKRPYLIGEGTVIEEGVNIQNSVLGPDCYVGQGSVIEGSILWSGVEVGKRVNISYAVIASGSVIEDGCRIEGSILGEGVKIGAGSITQPWNYFDPETVVEPGTVFE